VGPALKNIRSCKRREFFLTKSKKVLTSHHAILADTDVWKVSGKEKLVLLQAVC
jgi:hypothetical protein